MTIRRRRHRSPPLWHSPLPTWFHSNVSSVIEKSCPRYSNTVLPNGAIVGERVVKHHYCHHHRSIGVARLEDTRPAYNRDIADYQDVVLLKSLGSGN